MTFSRSSEKEKIRLRLLAERDRLSPELIGEKSRQIAVRLLGLKFWESFDSVALYAPIKNEVRTENIAEEFFKTKKVFYPRVKGLEIDFYQVKSITDLSPGFCQIPEPNLGNGESSLREIDCIIIPGVAFDRDGYRLGFGRGYYDKALAGYTGLVIGLAYDFQILDRLPRDPHDVGCHWIVSETQVYQRD
ncbi:MAG: 5-formyltetrahydrofolate cyclo-ligase [Deltaproteobacteria bacterium]|nr:MAG: 5-formyltetrahydrofolate cyclo-ligase [Deltaproteobacteria bacterium]